MKVKVHSIETMGTSDGYGIRYIVFLSDCLLTCSYCCNIDCAKGRFSKVMTPQEIIADMNKMKEFYLPNKGGVTLCGGEPLLHTEFAIELFKLARAEGYTTCLDTCGYTTPRQMELIPELLQYTDHVLMDFKAFDNTRHRGLTQGGNRNILKVMDMVTEAGVELWIRHVVVNGINTDELGARDIDFVNILTHIAKDLPTVTRFDLLPFHNFGAYKWEEVGLPYVHGEHNVPTESQMKSREKIAQDIFKDYGRSIQIVY